MLCERCKQREAWVHITQTSEDNGWVKATIHLCQPCGDQYDREQFLRQFPPSQEQPIHEELRVIESSKDYTVLRLVRTESQPHPTEWRLLTARLPAKYCLVGEEFGLTVTARQLEYLKGTREA